MRQRQYGNGLALYERVLAGFLADPRDRASLHRGLAGRIARFA